MKTYKFDYVIDKNMIDINNHANNVKYVEIMQKVAYIHSNAVGDTIDFKKKMTLFG